MSISFELPVAKEAALVEFYRQGRITQHQLGLSLDKSRFEVEVLLKRHNVTEDLDTAEQVAEHITILRRLLISRTNADLTP